MAENLKIEVTDKQKFEIGDIVAANLGGHFQFRLIRDTVVMTWQFRRGDSIREAIIAPDGEVAYVR